jgi:uncharacterized protein (TIGR02246 family)
MTSDSQTATARPNAATGQADGTIRDPDSLHERFCEACNAGQLDRLLDLYEPGAVIVEPTGELSEGTEAIREHLSKLLAMRPSMQILGSRTVVAGDVAQSSSHWHCDAVAPDGSPVHLEFHGSELSRRQPDGSWRLVVDNPWGAASLPS